MRFKVEFEQEEDGRWIAEVPDLRGVLAYGADRAEAQAKVQALALRVVAERLGRRTRRCTSRGTELKIFQDVPIVINVCPGGARRCYRDGGGDGEAAPDPVR